MRVSVIEGSHLGAAGFIISVEDLGTDPLYLVELETGEEALISQSSLRLPDA